MILLRPPKKFQRLKLLKYPKNNLKNWREIKKILQNWSENWIKGFFKISSHGSFFCQIIHRKRFFADYVFTIFRFGILVQYEVFTDGLPSKLWMAAVNFGQLKVSIFQKYFIMKIVSSLSLGVLSRDPWVNDLSFLGMPTRGGGRERESLIFNLLHMAKQSP